MAVLLGQGFLRGTGREEAEVEEHSLPIGRLLPMLDRMSQIPSLALHPQDQEQDHTELLRLPRHAHHSIAPSRIR